MHRSYLYVPGDRPERIDKALGSGADAIIADLEDGVVASKKDEARAAVAKLLARDDGGGPEILVRVNNSSALADDLDALLGAGCDVVYLPKADSESVAKMEEILAASDHGDVDLRVVALIESARGMLDAPALATHPRVWNLAIGEADLTAELGIVPSEDGRELWPLRSALVLASAAARIDPPTAPVNTDFRDLDGLRSDTEALRRAGFGARSAIHPAQVPVINEVFTPGDEQVARAKALVDLFDASVARGQGTCVDESGRMVDEAVVRSARRLMSRARPTV